MCVFHLDAIRAQTNNWIQLLYFSRGFIDVDRRSIGVCRVRHFLSTVENLTLPPPSLSLPSLSPTFRLHAFVFSLNLSRALLTELC
jgi:hypothetical protein